ncbi:MAG TPA: outer membrane protein assembly factor BamD [Vulgatibacter sp.]|nr:outer membrane protein assembly factor BamD [Vulgatibacter sp.]
MEKELAEIRKEVIEARNLVIKNDNLLKNLVADIKAFGKKQESFERKQRISAGAAYLAFTVLAAGGAVLASKGYVATAQAEAAALSVKAAEATESARQAREDLNAAREASKQALAAYQKLDAGTPEEREAAVAALLAVDRTKISRLEARALDDRGRAVIQQLANERLEAGRNAYRRSDWKTAAAELEKALTIWPEHPAADENSFYLGSASLELKRYQAAAENLSRFLSRYTGRTNKDYAHVLLARAQEALGDKEKAQATLRDGIATYPASQFVPHMRRHLSNLRKEAAARP